MMTTAEAITKAKSGWWKGATACEIVRFQLFEEKLCMDFPDFHTAVEKCLMRLVYTHEFAAPEHLIQEFNDKHPETM